MGFDDYAQALGAAQQLVPNWRAGDIAAAELAQRRLQPALIQAQIGQAQQAQALVRQKAEQDASRRAAFEAGLQGLGARPSPQAYRALGAQFPEFREALGQAADGLDAEKSSSLVRRLAPIQAQIAGGRYDAAAAEVQRHIAADKAAGLPIDEDDQELYDALSSGDPARQKAAGGIVSGMLYSLDPKNAAENLAKSAGDAQYTLAPGSIRFDATGREVARAPFAPEYRSVGEGDTLVQVGGSEGGGPASNGGGNGATGAQIEAAALGAVPGAVVTSRQRSAAKNAAVGGVANSYHLTDRARDFVPPSGMSMGGLASRLRQAMPGFEVINEGDHVHVEPRSGGSQGGGARVVARGAPKRGYSILTPQEVAAIPGLSPNGVYQRGPDGNITSVGGQDKTAPLKPWPASQAAAHASNGAAVKNIDSAISLLDPKNTSLEARRARNAIGPGTGFLGDAVTQWNNPEGTDARARIGQIGGIIIKDTSGAAVSLSEDARLAKWVPLVTDRPQVARAKLLNLRRELRQRNQVFEQTFSEEQGYRPLSRGGSQAAPSTGFRILRVRAK